MRRHLRSKMKCCRLSCVKIHDGSDKSLDDACGHASEAACADASGSGLVWSWLILSRAHQLSAADSPLPARPACRAQLRQEDRCRRTAGLEQYTQQHWDILQPKRLGFKGTGVHETDPETVAAEARMAAFFKPHNARLDALMADHGWPWTPFDSSAESA